MPPISKFSGDRILFDSHSDGHSKPLYRQVYHRFREAIANEALQPGSRVPSIRALAHELKLSRNTIEMAYDLLIGEGYLVPYGQRGTIVSPLLKPQLVRSAIDVAPPVGSPLAGKHVISHVGVRPFQLGLPAVDAFPRRLWSSLYTRHLMQVGDDCWSHPDPAGMPRLREMISAHLHITRGLSCMPSQVFVTNGYKSSLRLIADSLLSVGDAVCIEDPCFPPTRDVLRSFGAVEVPVRVDAQGLDVAALVSSSRQPALVVVTPSHQSPLGMTLSMARRRALLDWSRNCGAWIVDDDYDSEFRYDGRTPPAFSATGQDDRIIHLGTFSKVLSPALRLAYVVVPTSLVQRFSGMTMQLQDSGSPVTQGVLAGFMEQGHLARHVKKMGALYLRRRMFVVDTLSQVCGARLNVELPVGGLHVVARLTRDSDDDVALAAAAQAEGLATEPLSKRYINAPTQRGLLLGFANVSSQEDAMRQACRLREVILKSCR